MNIRGESISYSAFKTNKTNHNEKLLIKEIEKIEQSLKNNNEELGLLETKNAALEKIRKKNKMQGI